MPQELNSKTKETLNIILGVEREIRSLKASLNAWVYGVNKASLTKTGDFFYGESVTRETAKMWMKNIVGWNPAQDTPYELVVGYINHLDKMLLMRKSNFKVESKGENLTVTIKGRCLYEDACRWLSADLVNDVEVPCPRAILLATAIEVGCKTRYNVKLFKHDIGVECIAELQPSSTGT